MKYFLKVLKFLGLFKGTKIISKWLKTIRHSTDFLQVLPWIILLMENLVLRCDYGKNDQNRGFNRYSPKIYKRKFPVTNLISRAAGKKLLEYLYFYLN